MTTTSVLDLRAIMGDEYATATASRRNEVKKFIADAATSPVRWDESVVKADDSLNLYLPEDAAKTTDYHASSVDRLLALDPTLGELEVTVGDALAAGCCTSRLSFRDRYFAGAKTATVAEVWAVGNTPSSYRHYVAKTLGYVIVRHLLATGVLVKPDVTHMTTSRRSWGVAYTQRNDAMRALYAAVTEYVTAGGQYKNCAYYSFVQQYHTNREEYNLMVRRDAERTRQDEERRQQRVREQRQREAAAASAAAVREAAEVDVLAALQTLADTGRFSYGTIQTARNYLLNSAEDEGRYSNVHVAQ